MTELEKAADTYSQFACNRSDFDLTMLVESAFKTGAKWAFQNRDIEKIVCAACKYKFRGDDVVTLGYRHNGAIFAADGMFFLIRHPLHGELAHRTFRESEVQGFITTKNRFVDRKEAAEVAYSAGQIASPKTELHSEDLY